MADPLSIGASILAFIGLADRIIRASRYCIESVQDAPNDIQMILGEVSSLKAIIESFSDSEWYNNSATNLVPSLFVKPGPVDACRRCLSGLEALLPAEAQGPPTAKRCRFTINELAWPLKQSKARKLLAEISHHKATLLLAISGDMSHDLKDIKAGLQRLQDVMSDSERHEVIRWLERTNPSSLHNTAFKKHERHTSAWLLGSSEWKNWLARSPSDKFLWIYGLPGAGKTVLVSYVIEELKRFCGHIQGCGYAYYYCHYSHNQDEATPFLSWTVGQVCRQTRWIPRELKDLHDRGCDASIPELENALEMVLERFEVLYLVIDAVDESAPREDLLGLIATMALDKRFQKIKILATSRQYFDIERLFSGISTSISMSNPLVDADIRCFVRAKLASSHRLRRWHHLLEEIEDVLVAKAQGMFRWAECQIQSLERLRDQSQLRAALLNLPQDLRETYVSIFGAIPEVDWPFVRRILVWVCGHSRAPWLFDRGINAKLLLSAVAYDFYGPGSNNGACIFDCDYLQELCSCLITVRTVAENDNDTVTGKPDPVSSPHHSPHIEDSRLDGVSRTKKKVSTDGAELFVSLAHYTVLEFLTSPHILQTHIAFFALSSELIESEFATSVLRQALAADPEGTTADWVHDREAYCLTLGCTLNREKYLAKPEVQDLFLQYLTPFNPHFSRFRAIQTRIVLSNDESQSYYLKSLPARFYMTSAVSQHDHSAEALLTLLLIPESRFREGTLSIIQRLLLGRSIRELLETRLSGIFVDEAWEESEGLWRSVYRCCDVNFEGTVREILQSRQRRIEEEDLSEFFNAITGTF